MALQVSKQEEFMKLRVSLLLNYSCCILCGHEKGVIWNQISYLEISLEKHFSIFSNFLIFFVFLFFVCEVPQSYRWFSRRSRKFVIFLILRPGEEIYGFFVRIARCYIFLRFHYFCKISRKLLCRHFYLSNDRRHLLDEDFLKK